ncbi:MAG: thiolase domain-containing protein, partial [Brevibacterium aurantiacum]|nr:thiolase domain-containing protein [Brevibacterium aurantiacum]
MPKPAIIGWSHGKFGRSESPLPEMMGDVARDAIADAGLEPSDIDVIHVGVYNNGLSKQGFEAALPGVVFPELSLTPAHRHENACATGSTAVFSAHDSIAAGRHKTALVIGAERMTQASGHDVN